MTDDLIKHFFGGFVRLHILYHAEQEPICGVEMIEELARHGYSLSPGTLYPIFHQLESGGYLVATKQVVAGRQRKNYRITAAGRKLLREARAKLLELGDEVLGEREPKSQSPSKTKRTRRSV